MQDTKVHAGHRYYKQPDGTWKKGERVNAGPQPINVSSGDPYQAPKAAADASRAQADAVMAQAQTPYAATVAQAEADKAKADAAKAAIQAEEAKAERESGGVDRMKLAQFRALESQIARVRELYKAGPGSTKGVRGVADYLPSDVNAAFDSAAAGLGEVGLAAFRVPGVGSQSDNELRQFILANTPSASDRDSAIEEKLGNLERRLYATKQELGWNNDETPKLAGEGATTTLDGVPPEYQAAYDNFLNNIWDGTPEQYARFRTSLDERYFPNEAVNQYDTYLEEGYVRSLNRGAGNTQIPGVEREMTAAEQARNNLSAGDVGTAAINYFDSAGFGGVSAIDRALGGDRVAQLNQMNPEAALIGQIGGAITGTAGVGKLGRMALGTPTAGKFNLASRLLSQGGKARFGRNLATDVGYSAAYGANTGQDPLESALWGAGGSVGGQALGKVISTPLTGIKGSPAAQYLASRKIPMTVGQKIGGLAKSAEDAATSVPIVGDIINARRLEGLQAFNREAFNEAGKPIGFATQRIGSEGLSDLQGATGQAYDAALDGLDVPLDAQFLQDTGMAVAPLQNLPADIRRPMGEVMNARIQPIADADSLTGPSYQAARSTLKATRNKVPTRFEGYDPEYRQAATDLIDALDSQVTRGASPDVVAALESANQSNRLGKIVQDATEKAKGGSGSGEVRTFTPSQLQMANQTSGRRFPGANPMTELADQGQRVLPSRIPDSGTPQRLMQAALGTTVLGGAGGYDYYTGGDSNALRNSLAALALLSAGGSRTGQRALTEGILPSDAKKLRAIASRIPGIFGSASLPFFITPQQ